MEDEQAFLKMHRAKIRAVVDMVFRKSRLSAAMSGYDRRKMDKSSPPNAVKPSKRGL
tara:strand:- start:1314 stop:1484 length:171 start_codon:yes stop_codon:yes gene_type:complete